MSNPTWTQTKPQFWTRTAHGKIGNVWEVAARPGNFQWSVRQARPAMTVANGTEMCDTLAEAQEEAGLWL